MLLPPHLAILIYFSFAFLAIFQSMTILQCNEAAHHDYGLIPLQPIIGLRKLHVYEVYSEGLFEESLATEDLIMLIQFEMIMFTKLTP